MTTQFLHISFDFGTEVDEDNLKQSFDLAQDWVNYIPNCWIVLTDRSAQEWYEHLKPLLGPKAHLFICKIDLSERQGWLPKWVWKWFPNKNDLIRRNRTLLVFRDRFDTWINESRTRFENLVEERLKDEQPSRYSHGVWTVAYSISGELTKPTLKDFLDILISVQGHETGWPPWWVPNRSEIKPYPYDGLVECWLMESYDRQPDTSDFWRASPEGLMYLLRGYQEDSKHENIAPGTILDVTIPLWRIGECLLHAERLAVALGDPSASITFRASWEGLVGRALVNWAQPDLGLHVTGQCRQEKVSSEKVAVQAEAISATLPIIVETITRPLYEAFDFFKLPSSVIEQEVNKMRTHRYRP
jgi:transcriptional regulator with XRE-family HTH domain